MSLDSLINDAQAQFHRRFHRRARWVVSAPGRVNLIGEHTDYNDGFVLPMAIERSVVLAADQAPAEGEPQARLYSQATDSSAIIDLSQAIAPGVPHWANYPRGVMAGFQRRGVTLPGFDAVIVSDVPPGGGLSSSAALEVATATLLEALTRHPLDPVEKALLCQQAEHEFAGVPCGIMDQFASALGQAGQLLFLDCRTRQVEAVPFSDPALAILIMNSNVRHELSGGEYAQRRQQCEQAARVLNVPSLRDATLELLENRQASLDDVLFRRARHVISEIGRTVSAAAAIRAGDGITFGRLMDRSHASLRDDFEVSCAELDTIVDLAQQFGVERGVLGCRMTGGGFGGCAVALVRADDCPAISQHLAKNYQMKTGRELSFFVSRPAGGAKVVVGP